MPDYYAEVDLVTSHPGKLGGFLPKVRDYTGFQKAKRVVYHMSTEMQEEFGQVMGELQAYEQVRLKVDDSEPRAYFADRIKELAGDSKLRKSHVEILTWRPEVYALTTQMAYLGFAELTARRLIDFLGAQASEDRGPSWRDSHVNPQALLGWAVQMAMRERERGRDRFYGSDVIPWVKLHTSDLDGLDLRGLPAAIIAAGVDLGLFEREEDNPTLPFWLKEGWDDERLTAQIRRLLPVQQAPKLEVVAHQEVGDWMVLAGAPGPSSYVRVLQPYQVDISPRAWETLCQALASVVSPEGTLPLAPLTTKGLAHLLVRLVGRDFVPPVSEASAPQDRAAPVADATTEAGATMRAERPVNTGGGPSISYKATRNFIRLLLRAGAFTGSANEDVEPTTQRLWGVRAEYAKRSLGYMAACLHLHGSAVNLYDFAEAFTVRAGAGVSPGEWITTLREVADEFGFLEAAPDGFAAPGPAMQSGSAPLAADEERPGSPHGEGSARSLAEASEVPDRKPPRRTRKAVPEPDTRPEEA